MPGIRYRQAKRLSKMVSEKPAPGNPSNAVSTSFCHVTKYRSRARQEGLNFRRLLIDQQH